MTQIHTLRKLAAAGRADRVPAWEWSSAVEKIAKAAQRPDETFESAYARATASGDGASFLAAQRQAEDAEQIAQRGRPRQHEPGEIRRGQIEQALSAAALELATARGISFEKAFSDVLDTEAGRQLYTALRAAAPNATGE